MADEIANPQSKKVQLFEERGETSRYIDAEITEDGAIVMMGQDIGKLPEEFWGDSDYEFFVYVPAVYMKEVYRVLLEKLRMDDPDTANQLKKSGDIDDAILTLLEKLYAGNPKAVDQFKDYMRSRGIPAEFSSWA